MSWLLGTGSDTPGGPEFKAEGWESSFRREVLAEARVGASAILARADSTEFSRTSCAAHFVLWAALPPPLSFPGSADAVLPSPLPDTANDNQLIQHNLVHYEPLDW